MKKFLSKFYNHIVSKRKHKSVFWKGYSWFFNQVRKVIVLVYDPLVKVKLSEHALEMPLSHPIPYIFEKYPKYDRTLPRLGQKLIDIDGKLTVIDVGANIGDTIFLINEKAKGHFLAVEGNNNFIPVLERNLKLHNLENVVIVKTFCGEEKEAGGLNIVTKKGTAYVEKANTEDNKDTQKMTTIDDLVREFSDFSQTNLFKIDTDGFELPILKGSKVFLKSAQPLLYFEFTPDLMENPIDIFTLIQTLGYDYVLFYTNYGEPVKLFSLSANFDSVKALIKQVDKKSIYYFDVLCCHKSKEDRYLKVLEAEVV